MSNRLRWLMPALLVLQTLLPSTVTAQNTGGNNAATAAVEAVQNQILADPQLAGRVQALGNDPLLREVLADPDVADALNRGDFAALLANPKVRSLADDPAMRNLTRDIISSD